MHPVGRYLVVSTIHITGGRLATLKTELIKTNTQGPGKPDRSQIKRRWPQNGIGGEESETGFLKDS